MGQIDKFRSMAAQANGFARPSKFKVRIGVPGALVGVDGLYQLKEQVELFCYQIEMPGHDLVTQTRQHGSSPAREMVTSHGFKGNIKASFYLSEDMREKAFFEAWQNLAVDPFTHKANYYDDYIGSLSIFQLTQQGTGQKVTGRMEGPRNSETTAGFFSPNDLDIMGYGIEVTELYPEQITAIDFDYGSTDEIQTFTVQFGYREWRNLEWKGFEAGDSV